MSPIEYDSNGYQKRSDQRGSSFSYRYVCPIKKIYTKGYFLKVGEIVILDHQTIKDAVKSLRNVFPEITITACLVLFSF